jgi:hypothetical protein
MAYDTSAPRSLSPVKRILPAWSAAALADIREPRATGHDLPAWRAALAGFGLGRQARP